MQDSVLHNGGAGEHGMSLKAIMRQRRGGGRAEAAAKARKRRGVRATFGRGAEPRILEGLSVSPFWRFRTSGKKTITAYCGTGYVCVSES